MIFIGVKSSVVSKVFTGVYVKILLGYDPSEARIGIATGRLTTPLLKRTN